MQKTLSQRSWEWIKNQPDFHSTELAKAMNVPRTKIKTVMDEFVRKGHVEAANTAAKPYVYRATEKEPSFERSRPNPHPERNARQKIWQAMRFLSSQFTVEEVQAATGTSRSNVTRFISDLIKYRYVAKTRGQWGKAKQRHARECKYLLLENTGHKYPVIKKTGLWDQNLRKLIPKPDQEK